MKKAYSVIWRIMNHAEHITYNINMRQTMIIHWLEDKINE